ncbi:MAG: sugar ABC transporter permease [Chloroflexi bacterium]|nr:sugar ABC transporter permease [Chloroflexota bacterium]
MTQSVTTHATVVRVPFRERFKTPEWLSGYLFISPWIVGFLVFTLGPFIASLYISFTEWDFVKAPEFIGADNYVKLVNDPLFWQSLKVTTVYALGRVPLGIAVGLAAALLLNQKVRFVGLWRVIYYMPVVLPPVAVSLLWMWVYNPDYGILNGMLWTVFGIRGPAWLQNEFWVLPSLMMMAVWGMLGKNMIVYLSGLQSIAPEMYEAADIDGANVWRKFFNITLPMMTPIIFFNLIMGLMDSFKLFTQAYVMTGGGPRYASLFYVYYLYQHAFQRFHMGYASAMAWVFFLILMLFTVLVFRSSKLWVYYESTLGKGK